VRYAWDKDTESFESSWDFLDSGHEPLVDTATRKTNLERFWRYMPVFHLDALRSAKDAFSARSS